MTESLPQRIVPFYGDDLIAVQQAEGDVLVVFGRLCDNLGLDRSGQVQRIQRHEVLKDGLITVPVQTEGGAQTMQCLRLDLLPLWLAGIQAKRVKDALREQLIRYQREAAQALWREFRAQILVTDPGQEASTELSPAMVQLHQIAEMGRAIVAMAEQQMEIQRQQQALSGRLDKAGMVVKGLQGEVRTVTRDVSDLQVRLGVLEERIHPSAYITDEQGAEVSQQVKALAETLTGKDKTKNHYQGIFSELYRRYGVASYKLIRQDQYAAVLAFLDDWRNAVLTGEAVSPPDA
jgi:hypothetical protein